MKFDPEKEFDPQKEFDALTEQRFSSMQRRFRPLPFTLTRYREFVIDLLGGVQGLTRCEYCNTPLDLLRLELDHRLPPISQGGSRGLDNLAPCCMECNQQKGQMSSPAFLALRDLVFNDFRFTQVDRVDLLGRLQSHLKLAIREQARLAQARRGKVRVVPHQRKRSA